MGSYTELFTGSRYCQNGDVITSRLFQYKERSSTLYESVLVVASCILNILFDLAISMRAVFCQVGIFEPIISALMAPFLNDFNPSPLR
ncbi:hypothetical protein D3C85_1784450 [compost metagenome]